MKQKGFTLVELLVAVAIFAVVAMVAYGGLNSVMNTSRMSAGETKRLDNLQRTFLQMASDFEQAVDRSVRDDLGDDSAAMVYTSAPLSLQLTRAGWVNPAEQLRSSLQRVNYVLEQDRLLRLYWNDLDRLQGATVRRRLLLEHVDEFEIRFLDSSSNWQDQWPPLSAEGGGGLPRAIEVKLKLPDWGELRRVYALPG